MKIARESLRHLEAAAEVAEIAGAAEGGRGRHHDRRRSDHHHDRTQHRVGLFVVKPSRGDALVNHIRLLEEELPRRDCGADDGEDHQRPRRGDPSLDSWHQEASEHGARRGMAERGQRQHEQAGKEKDEHRPLPLAEVSAGGDADQDQRRDRDDDVTVEPEVFGGQPDSDELRADDQEVEQEQPRHRIPAPEAAESLDDELGQPDAGDGAQAHDHLLVHDQHRRQQQQGPEQRIAVVLARLRVGGDTAGVVVADQHDQPRADDRRQSEQPLPPGSARRYIAEADGPERAMDVAGLIQNALSGNRSRVVLRRLALGHQVRLR